MARKFIKECLIRFVEPEVPDLYWELSVQQESHNETKQFMLKLQIPVPSCGLVHQSFPLQKDDMEQLSKWISTATAHDRF